MVLPLVLGKKFLSNRANWKKFGSRFFNLNLLKVANPATDFSWFL